MFDAIITLLSSFLAICCFRLAPQDLPSSSFLLRVTIGLYFVCSFAISLLSVPFIPAFILTLVDTCFMVAFTLIALRTLRLNMRVTQTLTAQAGTAALLTLAFLPLVAAQPPSTVVSDAVEVTDILHYLLVIWSWLVLGHIFRHAFSLPWIAGIGLALVNYWMQLTLLNAVYASLVRL